MNEDDQMQKSSQGKNLSSPNKNRDKQNHRSLITNSSLIKSYQAKREDTIILKTKEDSIVLPELPRKSKGQLIVLEKAVVKKLPSTGNVINPFEGADNSYLNLARKTENIKIMGSKKAMSKADNNDQDVSMYSAEHSFEELKEDMNSSIEGDNLATSIKQSQFSQENGNKKQSVKQTQAQKVIQMRNSSCINESMREYVSSEAYSPDEHHLGSHAFKAETVQTAKGSFTKTSKPEPKMPAFTINIKETRDENSSNPSEELASNQSKQTIKDKATADNDMFEKEIQQKLKEEILSIVGGPEPLYELTHKYAEGSDSPMWKRKQMRNHTIIEPAVDNEEVSEASVSLSDGEEGSDLPGDQQSEKSDNKSFRINDQTDKINQKKKKTKKNKSIQEKLERQGERILIQTEKAIDISNYSDLFGYMIYDGYRPQNLAQTRDYLEFLTKSQECIGGDVLSSAKTPPHILEYLERNIDTVLPHEIDQKSILRFDQNFEGGNLDSAYIMNPLSYNLLLKVDSNTRGNTYWFYFSVQGFKVGQRYTFNIYNFTRSMEKFYKDGMNVLTRSESLGPDDVDAFAERIAGGTCSKITEVSETLQNSTLLNDKNGDETFLQVPSEPPKKEQSRASTPKQPSTDSRFKEWKYGACENVRFEASDIPRTKNMINMAKYQMSVKDKEKYFYSMLSFSYRFKPEDTGKKVYFAYALPYSYSDLLYDLQDAKNNLISQMSPLYNQQGKKAEENEQLEDPIGNLNTEVTPNYRIIDKTDIFDVAKMKNLSTYHNDQQYKTGQELDSPEELRADHFGQETHNRGLNSHASNTHNSDDRKITSKSLNPKKITFIGQKTPQQQKPSAHAFMHDQIRKQGTEFMQFKSSKFESEFIKREVKGTNQLKELILNEAATNPLSNQHNFEISNDYLQWRQEVIAQTMGGLNVFQITLTKRRKAGSIPHKKKQVIYIQARVHAAETHGSFIMSSIIKELSQNYIKYDQILKDNIIKLVPMVNPDGVVLGNSRSSLAGVDLNRRWSNPNSTLHPELYFLKMSMRETKNDSNGIQLFCDLHGHNKNSNCFIYGCNKAPNEGLLSWTKTRLLPKIFASYEPIFDFNMCKFSQEKTKYNTARVVVWNEFKVTNSFTLETSQYGQKQQKDAKMKRGNCIQLFIQDFNDIGINLLQSINKFVVIEAKLKKDLKKNGGWFKKKILDEITGQSARSKLDYQNSQFNQIRKYSESSKQVLGAFQKKGIKPGRHNTSDNLMLTNRLGKNQNKKGSQRNVFNQTQGNVSKKDNNAIQKKTDSIRVTSIASEESLSVQSTSDNGTKIQNQKAEIHTPVTAGLNDKQRIGNIRNHSSFRVTKTESSPIKGSDQALSWSTKSPGARMTNNKKAMNETPKKSQFSKKGADQSRKKVKDAASDEPMKLPDCLAEFFSKNEFKSAVLESQIPTQPKEADNISKQDEAESDSEPSCDNFEVNEMKKIFSNAISDEDLDEVFADDIEPDQITEAHEKLSQIIYPEKAHVRDLNTVIEQISEHDELQEQQSIDMSYEEETKTPQRQQRRGPVQLPGSKSPTVQNMQQHPTQNQMDTERLREQIKSIQDYKQIAKQLKSAQMESKMLADKFDSLSRQLNKKIKDDTSNTAYSFVNQSQIQATLVQPQVFGNGWEQVRDTNTSNQFAAHARTSSLQPIQDINSDMNKMRKALLPAGPMSGESKSGERMRQRGVSTNVIMHIENNSNLPAIAQNSFNNQNLAQKKKKTMATSQAKASKYKSRNNVLSMSAYNMENGLATLTKNTNILGSIKAQQAQTHVHPQFAMQSQMMPKNQVAQGLNGMMVGHQVQVSPNQNSANKARRKRKPDNIDQILNNNQLPRYQNPQTSNQQHNADQQIKSEQSQRNESIRTNGSIPINPHNSIITNQNQYSRQPQHRNKVLSNKHISMPVGSENGYSVNGTSLYHSESQSYAPSSNEMNQNGQQQIMSNQAMMSQVDQIRKDVQTSPVQKGGYYLNSSLEWVMSNDGGRNVSTDQDPNQSGLRNMSVNTHLKVQDLNQLNRNTRLSPQSILVKQGNSSGNKLRKQVINARQNLEEQFQNQFIISQQDYPVTPSKMNQDYQQNYNGMPVMKDNIHNVLQINSRIITTDMNKNTEQMNIAQQQKTRKSVQFNNQDQSQREQHKVKSQTPNRNFFQNENVKQFSHNQQIILKPHQIRRGAADQIIQQDQMNSEVINKQRRFNNTKVNQTVQQKNSKEPLGILSRDHNTVMQNVPQRVSIPNVKDRDLQIIQKEIGSATVNKNPSYGLSPQSPNKRKMIKVKTQQEEQAQNEQIEGQSCKNEYNMNDNYSGNKRHSQELQVNYNKTNQVQHHPKTMAISPMNQSRMNRMSYIQSHQVQYTASPHLDSIEQLNNNFEQTYIHQSDKKSIQTSGLRVNESSIESQSRASNRNYQLIHKSPELINKQAQSKRYATNSNLPSGSPKKQSRGSQPGSNHQGMTNVAYMNSPNNRIPHIILSPRQPISQTPQTGTNFQNKMIRNSIPTVDMAVASPDWAQSKELYELKGTPQRINTDTDYKNYHLSPVKITEPTNTGKVNHRKTLSTFDAPQTTNSAVNQRKPQFTGLKQEYMLEGDNQYQKGVQIKMSKQQVQNIIKQKQINKN